MAPRKIRLTVTVDPALVAAGTAAVEQGRADSVSSWVNSALEERIDRDRRLAQLGAAIADYEGEFGEITSDEVAAQARRDRGEAVVVRGRAARTRRSA